MNGEQVKIWTEMVIAYLKVPSWHSPGEIE